MSKGIDQVAAQAGIAADYINAHGQRQAISPETKRKLLAAMNPASLQPSTAPLPLVKVFYHGNPVALPLGEMASFSGYCCVRTVASKKAVPVRTKP